MVHLSVAPAAITPGDRPWRVHFHTFLTDVVTLRRSGKRREINALTP